MGKSKDLITKKIISNQDIVDLISTNILPSELIYENIFDTLTIDIPQDERKTYITMDAVVSSVENRHIKSVDIIIHVFTHLKLLKLSTSEQQKYYTRGFFGNRIDVLIDLLVRMLDGSDEFGIGRLQLKPRSPMSVIHPSTKHYGKSLIFYTCDFN